MGDAPTGPLGGRMEIEVDGTPVDLSGLGRIDQLFFAYLVCERHRRVTKDELAEVRWGQDELPRSWDQMLRGHASKVRAVLDGAGLDAPVGVTSAFGALQIHLPADAVVDVEEATADVDRALVALRSGDAENAYRAAGRAAAVAVKGFLPGWVGIWVERRQAEARELRLRALEVLAEAACAPELWSEVVAASEEAVAIEPFRESAVQVLMAAQRGAGNPAEVLQAYERCRRVLAEDLDVSPAGRARVAVRAVAAPVGDPGDLRRRSGLAVRASGHGSGTAPRIARDRGASVEPLPPRGYGDEDSADFAERVLRGLGHSAPPLRARLLAGLAAYRHGRSGSSAEMVTREALALARGCGDHDALHAALVARKLVLADSPNAREWLDVEEELVAIGPQQGPWRRAADGSTAWAEVGRSPASPSATAAHSRPTPKPFADGRWKCGTRAPGGTTPCGEAPLPSSTDGSARSRHWRRPCLASRRPTPLSGSTRGRRRWGRLALDQGRAAEFKSEMIRVRNLKPDNPVLTPMVALLHAEVGERPTPFASWTRCSTRPTRASSPA